MYLLLNKLWLIFKNNQAIFVLLFLCWTAGCGFVADSLSYTLTDPWTATKGDGEEDREISLQSLETQSQKKAGILFVVDTSYSMVRHLTRVPQTFKSFIPSLGSLHWQMMFTNADYNPNKVSTYYNSDLFMGKAMRLEWQNSILPRKVLHSHSEEKEQIFLNTLKRYEPKDTSYPRHRSYVNPCELPPFCQGSVRNPIQSLVQAFSTNKPFFKDITHLVAIIWTNGDNMSNAPDQNEKVVQAFQKIHGSNKTLTVYSIAIIPGDDNCLNYDRKHFSPYRFAVASQAKKVHELVRWTKGKTMNICDSDYSLLAKAIVRSL